MNCKFFTNLKNKKQLHEKLGFISNYVDFFENLKMYMKRNHILKKNNY